MRERHQAVPIMKWSLIGLFALGFVAATCAVVLVLSMRQEAPPAGKQDLVTQVATRRVLVAARELPQHHVLSADDLDGSEVELEIVPEGSFSDPVQVLGNVLVAPLAKGQPVLGNHFAREGSGAQLAASLPPGKRAVQIRLNDDLNAERLLYPGSLVDVVANLRVVRGSERETISFPILENIVVLAVGGRTVVAPEGAAGSNESTAPRARESVITLLVDPEQATQLALAQEEGTLEVVMRNPLDAERGSGDGVRLKSMLSALGFETQDDRLRERDRAELERAREEISGLRADLELSRRQIEQERARADKELHQALSEAAAQAKAAALAPESAEAEQWRTLVLRGGQASTKTFILNRASE